MGITPIHRHLERLSDRELFVHALLGLISVGDRIERGLDACLPRSQSRNRSVHRDQPIDTVTLLLLGCLSLRQRLLTELSSWQVSTPSVAPRAVELESAGSLLR